MRIKGVPELKPTPTKQCVYIYNKVFFHKRLNPEIFQTVLNFLKCELSNYYTFFS